MTDIPGSSPVRRSRDARHRLAEIDMPTPPFGLSPVEVSAVTGPLRIVEPSEPAGSGADGEPVVVGPSVAPTPSASFPSIPSPRRALSPVATGPTTGTTTAHPVFDAPARPAPLVAAPPVAVPPPAPPPVAVPPAAAPPPRRPPGGDSVLRRLGRASLDLVTGAAAARELVELAATAQLPVTTGRRIAVVGARGGAGRTTVAALLASVYAARRADHTLVVDADAGVGSLAWRLSVAADTDPATVGPRLLAARTGTLDDVEAVLPAVVAGLRVLPGGAQLPPELIRALSRFFAITVIDGGDAPQADAHASVLVTPTTPDGVRSTCAALDAWAGGPVVVALVARDRTRHDPAAALRRYGVPVVALPHDRHLAAGAAIRPDRTRAATRREATRLAGLALTAAVGNRR
jgi:Mrp family chromosome partitioning ATPase